jgi:hypothetical protein
VRLRQFCRKVDAALRPLLAGREEPLILAAAEPLLSIYRSVNSYDGLAARAIEGSPAKRSAAGLQVDARGIMDQRHVDDIAGFRQLYGERRAAGRATSQLSDAARAATFGAVEAMLVDIDASVTGTVDDATGEVRRGPDDATTYGIVDEIAGRVLATGGRVLGVRRQDLPDDEPLAALLRYVP